MKNKIYIFLLLAIVFTFTKCGKKDFDVYDPSAISVDQFFKTEADALQAVTACYNMLDMLYIYARVNFDVISDDIYGSDRGQSIIVTLDDFTYDNSNSIISSAWTVPYQGIARCNKALEKVPGITMDETLKSRLVAETKFLRAYFYYMLVRDFGDVPLLLKTVDIYNDAERLPKRTSKADVWAQIEKDLTEAIPDLPASYESGDIGRITKGAAMAYLGKAYLYQKKYAQAKDEFASVMALTQVNQNFSAYGLLPNYSDNFHGTHEWSQECILQVNFAAIAVANMWGGGVNNVIMMLIGVYNGGWQNVRPIQYAVSNFEPTDTIRMFESILGSYTVINGDTVGSKYDGKPCYIADCNGPLKSWGQMGEANLAIGKYVYHDNSPQHSPWVWDGTAPGGDFNYNLMRYSDVLLMYAEAVNETGGPTADAIAAVNTVRARVKLAGLSGSINQTDFRNAIKHERQVEFFYEDNRWYDLVRWGDCETAFAKANAYQTAHVPNSLADLPTFNPTKNYLLPIPMTEMQLNNNLVQNPNY